MAAMLGELVIDCVPCVGEAYRRSSLADNGTLWAHLSAIPPHPEVPAALARLRERYRIAIISNTANDLIAGTVRAIGTPFDFVVTAEQARAYKPDHQLFHHAHAIMGVTKEETIHVGMGQFTDLKVCRELGVRSIWIDRLGETLNPIWTPGAALKDLSGLPDLLFGTTVYGTSPQRPSRSRTRTSDGAG